jgi:glycosyltransferase involved in cell wall biosynthesis
MLARYLSLLLKNGDLRRKFGIAGRQRVLRLFDLKTQTRKLETIYADVLKPISSDARNLASQCVEQGN